MVWEAGNLFAGGATLFKVDSTDVGATSGGVRIRREADWLDFEIDQTTIIVKKQITLSRMFVETTFAEGTLDNLRLAWQIPSAALGSSSMSLEEPSGDSADEREITVVGKTITDPTNTKRTFNFPRTIALADGEYNLDRGTPSSIAVTFEVMAASGTTLFGSVWDSA